MKYLTLRDGARIPRLGQGTWYMGDDPKRIPEECDALKAGIEHGMTLIDSAEMYGGGRAESLVGKVVPGYPRDMLTLVSKVYPYNAGRDHIFVCCDASIRRMGAEYLDIYLLHWRGAIPLSETVECMEELIKRGKIRRWGVSNFDVDGAPDSGSICSQECSSSAPHWLWASGRRSFSRSIRSVPR